MTPLQQQIYQILNQNQGNRLTPELIAGVLTSIYNVCESDRKQFIEEHTTKPEIDNG